MIRNPFDTYGETDDQDTGEPTIEVEAIPDDSSQILVFRVPDQLDDETQEEYIEYISQLREGSGMQSKILILPTNFDISKVVK